ncbi:hypothetical protein V8E55_010523 [Tylopilus felleus]
MSLRSGTYEIYNVGANKYFDLKGSNIAPDTNIIGYQKTGNPNQKWVVSVSDDIIRLHSLLSSDAAVATKGHVGESEVVVRPNGERFTIVRISAGLYRIKVSDEDLYFRLRDGANDTPVRLYPVGLDNDIWRFDEYQQDPTE